MFLATVNPRYFLPVSCANKSEPKIFKEVLEISNIIFKMAFPSHRLPSGLFTFTICVKKFEPSKNNR